MEEGYWSSLMSRAKVTPAELKASIDLVWLVERYGVVVEPTAEGKWMGLCPFHFDSTPSFEVFRYGDTGEDKVGCWSCDFGKVNDHFDFISMMHGGIPFNEARDIAYGLLAENPPERREASAEAKVAKVDLNAFATDAVNEAAQNPGALTSFLHERGLTMPGSWLVEQFRVGLTAADHLVVAPHMDKAMEVTGAKVRRPSGFHSLYGSRLDHLYGTWRDRGHDMVVLVEGETDTWTVSWLLRDDKVDVLGVPSGATAHPKPAWVEQLQGRSVTVLLDADTAGRDAAKRWRDVLGLIRLARVREGEDASSVPTTELINALGTAQPTGTEPASYLERSDLGGYVKRRADGEAAAVSDFTVTPTSVTEQVDGGGHVFEVVLPNGLTTTLASDDLETEAKIRRWANGFGYTWVGQTRDAQELLRVLHVETLFKPRLLGTRTIGLHSGVFVLPDETIGANGWRFLPGPMSLVSDGSMVNFDPGPWDTSVPLLLSRLHQPAVITPLLGWVAASYLRPLSKPFPIFAIVGGAGWGKTTLVRTVLEAFGSMVATTLTATTPHAVTAFLSATNAIPVWFDEYRVGARDDSKKVFEQSLRDAWESSASFKGGLKSNLQEVTRIPVSAPIIVTGEDAFEETSHVERMCMIRLPKEGRDAAALHALQEVGATGFARAYVTWLMDTLATGELEAPPLLNARPEQARALAAWGYRLLNQFSEQTCGYSLPAYDESMLTAAHDHTRKRPVIVQAIRALEGRRGRQGLIVWRDETNGGMNIRLYDFVSECLSLNIPLPGGAGAVTSELEQRFDATLVADPNGEYLHVRGIVD